jgi:hypothetical protein
VQAPLEDVPRRPDGFLEAEVVAEGLGPVGEALAHPGVVAQAGLVGPLDHGLVDQRHLEA